MENFSKDFKKALEIIKLNKLAIASVYEKKGSFKSEALFLCVPIVVNVLLSSMLFPSGFRAIFSRYSFWPLIIPYLALTLALYLFLQVMNRHFKAGFHIVGVFRVFSYSSLLFWLTVIPFLFAVIGISSLSSFHFSLWMFAVFYLLLLLWHLFELKSRFKREELLVYMLALFLLYLLLQKLLGTILVGPYYRFML